MGERGDPDDLIGASEVQAILRLSHLSSVTTYLKGYPNLSKPVIGLSGSSVRLWQRQDIIRWRETREARP